MSRIPETIQYGGPVQKSDGTVIDLPEQIFQVEDAHEPDPSVGIFGEAGLLLAVPYAVDPEGVVFVSVSQFDDYYGPREP